MSTYRETQDIVIAGAIYMVGVDYDYFLENVKIEHLSVKKYENIYNIIKDLKERGVEANLQNIRLNYSDSIGSSFFTDFDTIEVLARDLSTGSWKEAIRVLKQRYRDNKYREILRNEKESNDSSEDFDFNQSIDNLVEKLYELKTSGGEQIKTFASYSNEYLDNLYEIKHGDKRAGLFFGYKSLDDVTCGIEGNRYLVLGALPGVGKTTALLNMTIRLLDQDKSVLIFSLEMSEKQLFNRIISIKTGIPLRKFRNDEQFDEDELQKIEDVLQWLDTRKLFVNTNMKINSDEIKSYAKQIQSVHGLDFLAVDHLHLLAKNEYGKDEREKVTYMSRKMKFLTKELDIPIMLLAQLSRDTNDQYSQNIPSSKRIKESAAVEEDADMVIMVHRVMKTPTGDQASVRTMQRMVLYFDKNRDGANEYCKFYLDLETQKLYDSKEILTISERNKFDAD